MAAARPGAAARQPAGPSCARDLVAAAVELFRTRGYDDTTIDDIAAAAGVGRRTFFRYFRSKEDAISPDHEAALARIAEIFESAHADRAAGRARAAGRGDGVRPLHRRPGPVGAPLRADPRGPGPARPRVGQRRSLPAVVHPPPAATAAAQADGELRAAVIGAAVVAAHNVALRTWLAAGAPPDGYDACRERFRRVAGLLPVDEPRTPGSQQLSAVARRLEQAVGRLERSTP